MRRFRSVSGWAGLGVVVFAACDLGPSGPSTVEGTVTGEASLGAAVLDVTWPGVVGFEGRGGTQVYFGAVPGFADRYRVILVSPSGGDIPFTISVDDAYLASPTVTVVEAASSTNQLLPLTRLRVVLDR